MKHINSNTGSSITTTSGSRRKFWFLMNCKRWCSIASITKSSIPVKVFLGMLVAGIIGFSVLVVQVMTPMKKINCYFLSDERKTFINTIDIGKASNVNHHNRSNNTDNGKNDPADEVDMNATAVTNDLFSTLFNRIPHVTFYPYNLFFPYDIDNNDDAEDASTGKQYVSSLKQQQTQENAFFMDVVKYNQRRHGNPAYIEFILNDTSSTTDSLNKTTKCIYIHLHKVGGTSVVRATYPIPELFQSVNQLYSQYRVHNKIRFQQRVQEWLKTYSAVDTGSTSSSSNNQTTRHESSNVNDIHFFSFVRDPATKFLSAVGQVLMGYPLSGSRWKRTISPCPQKHLVITANMTASSTRTTNGAVRGLLHCILDKMTNTKHNNYNPAKQSSKQNNNSALEKMPMIDYLDDHMLPQMIELIHGIDSHPNVPVILIDLQQGMNQWFQVTNAIPPLLNTTKSHTNSRTSTGITMNTVPSSSNNHNNHRALQGRRRELQQKNQVNEPIPLPKLSPLDIYQEDPYLLKRVCDIYKMDVNMLNFLNKAEQSNKLKSAGAGSAGTSSMTGSFHVSTLCPATMQ